jgi:hypothetical protein
MAKGHKRLEFYAEHISGHNGNRCEMFFDDYYVCSLNV